jgi:hypothetical protein
MISAIKRFTRKRSVSPGFSHPYPTPEWELKWLILFLFYLDFAGILTKEGKTLCRMGPNSIPKESVQPANPIAKLALKRGDIVAGTAVLSNEFLSAEDPELADRAKIQLVPTWRAAPRAETEETAGMALVVAIPVFEDDNPLGVLYGGILLNRSQKIVDLVRDR